MKEEETNAKFISNRRHVLEAVLQQLLIELVLPAKKKTEKKQKKTER